jgi:hypothetical protein
MNRRDGAAESARVVGFERQRVDLSTGRRAESHAVSPRQRSAHMRVLLAFVKIIY